MSEQSRILAEQFHMTKESVATNEQFESERKHTLDEGFARIRAELNSSLEKQCEEANREPLIGDILVCTVSATKSQVSRLDTGTALILKFDESLHKATFKCEQSAKYKYVVEVKEAPCRGAWWYADGDGSSIGIDPSECASWMASQALAALLGVAA